MAREASQILKAAKLARKIKKQKLRLTEKEKEFIRGQLEDLSHSELCEMIFSKLTQEEIAEYKSIYEDFH